MNLMATTTGTATATSTIAAAAAAAGTNTPLRTMGGHRHQAGPEQQKITRSNLAGTLQTRGTAAGQYGARQG